MTHESDVESYFYLHQTALGHAMEASKVLNSDPDIEAYRALELTIKAYLGASGMALVPRYATDEMLERMDLSYLTPEEAQESFRYILEAAPDPFKSEESQMTPEQKNRLDSIMSWVENLPDNDERETLRKNLEGLAKDLSQRAKELRGPFAFSQRKLSAQDQYERQLAQIDNGGGACEIFSKSRLPGDKDMIDAARRLSKNAGWSESEDFKSIFSALFDERERCAKIAEEMGNGGIADAIRY